MYSASVSVVFDSKKQNVFGKQAMNIERWKEFLFYIKSLM